MNDSCRQSGVEPVTGIDAGAGPSHSAMLESRLRPVVSLVVYASDKVRTLQSLGEDRDDFIEMVFSRYVDTSSLIGDLSEAQTRLETFRGMGVDEVACLVDFGIDKHHVLDSLHLLSQLIERRKK